MSKNNTVKLTQEGYDNLKEELRRLEEDERGVVAKELKEAIAEGDLSENAAYDEAKDRQARLEGRIIEIKQTLAIAEIVTNTKGDKINIGSTIDIKDSSGSKKTFTITGSDGASPAEGKISYDSPLGSAFVGHKKGDIVEVETPGGKKKYEILNVN
ncbi:MAG: transcription elongation factor GreA [Candidatus Spechtbacterales bacterium]